MIEYLIRLWCLGCREPFRRSSSGLYEELVRRTQQLIQLAEWEGWICVEGGQYFCPKCQIQRQGVERVAHDSSTPNHA